jgi:hypothetical protein
LEHDALGCHETNLQNNPYYLFVRCEVGKNIQCGIKRNGTKTYYDNVLMDANTTLHLRIFNDRDGVKKLLPSMPDDQALGKWELHTLEAM